MFYTNVYKFNYFNIPAIVNNYSITKSATLSIKDLTSLVTAQRGIFHKTEKTGVAGFLASIHTILQCSVLVVVLYKTVALFNFIFIIL